MARLESGTMSVVISDLVVKSDVVDRRQGGVGPGERNQSYDDRREIDGRDLSRGDIPKRTVSSCTAGLATRTGAIRTRDLSRWCSVCLPTGARRLSATVWRWSCRSIVKRWRDSLAIGSANSVRPLSRPATASGRLRLVGFPVARSVWMLLVKDRHG